VWACTVAPGKVVRLSDIPIDDFVAIASRFTVDWGDIYYAPLRNAAVGKALYELCCSRMGTPTNPDLTAGQLLDAFNLIPDDVPYSFTDGLPDPTLVDASTTPG